MAKIWLLFSVYLEVFLKRIWILQITNFLSFKATWGLQNKQTNLLSDLRLLIGESRLLYLCSFLSRFCGISRNVLLHMLGFKVVALSFLTWWFLIYYFGPFWMHIRLCYIAVSQVCYLALWKTRKWFFDRKYVFINYSSQNYIVCFCWWCVLFIGKV